MCDSLTPAIILFAALFNLRCMNTALIASSVLFICSSVARAHSQISVQRFLTKIACARQVLNSCSDHPDLYIHAELNAQL